MKLFCLHSPGHPWRYHFFCDYFGLLIILFYLAPFYLITLITYFYQCPVIIISITTLNPGQPWGGEGVVETKKLKQRTNIKAAQSVEGMIPVF